MPGGDALTKRCMVLDQSFSVCNNEAPMFGWGISSDRGKHSFMQNSINSGFLSL